MTVRPIDDVLVWVLHTDESAIAGRLSEYQPLLSHEERTQAARYRHDDDRVRFVMGRALARQLLSHLAPLDPRAWRFTFGEHGRPEIQMTGDLARLRFNLSHTPGLVVCAATVDCPVGIDVERIDRRLTHDVASRYFSPREVADLHALPSDEQNRAFFDYWTLKEAYIKAIGLGLRMPLDQFSFVLAPPAPPRISFDPRVADDPAAWQFVQESPTGEIRLALAIRSGERARPVRFEPVQAEALVA